MDLLWLALLGALLALAAELAVGCERLGARR